MADLAVAVAGRDEVRDDFGAGTYGVHSVLVELCGGRALEAPEAVCPESGFIVRVRRVGDFLDVYGWVEAQYAALDHVCPVRGGIDRGERSVRPVTDTDHRLAVDAAGMRIEVIDFLSVLLHFDKVRSIHHIPLSVNVICEYGSVVSPLGQVFYGCGPHPDVGAAVAVVPQVV